MGEGADEAGAAAGVAGAYGRRDYGEFLTTQQTRHALGVSRSAVNQLRRSERLTGHKRPQKAATGEERKWWFYRKEEVGALLADGEYPTRHRRARAGRGG